MKEYSDAVVGQLAEQLKFPKEKVINVLFLANLTRLLVNLIELMGERETTSHEACFLSLTSIDLVFPSQFLPPGERKGTHEAHIISELRTQIFIQTFKGYLDLLQEELDKDWDPNKKIREFFNISSSLIEWDTNDKIKEIFRIEEGAKRSLDADEQAVYPI